MNSHPDQAELKPQAAGLAIEGLNTTEDDLLDMISSLEARLGDVRELHQEQQDLEDELDKLRADLEARQAEMEEREQLLSESSIEIRSEREAVETQRRQLSEQQAAMERRRAELEAKEREITDRFSNVDEMQAKLEAAESALRAEREKREREAEKFRLEQAELAQREAELAAHARAQGRSSPEIAELAAQLAEAQKLAHQRAEEAEKRSSEAQRRTLELEKRCKDLAGECEIVRKELHGSRQRVSEVERELPARIYRHQARVQRGDRVRRAIASMLTWICVAVTLGAAAYSATNGETLQVPILLGLAFAAYFFGSHGIAGKLFDPPVMVIGLIGTSFGWWFPLWLRAVEQALSTWSLPVQGLPASVAIQLPLGLGLATAGLTITVGLFALTWSGKLLVQVGFVSILAGGLAMFPDDSGFALGAAAIIWHAVTGSGLARWAARAAPPLPAAATPLVQTDAQSAPMIGRAI
jgi:chemotaxis protein histidine kinase CheA